MRRSRRYGNNHKMSIKLVRKNEMEISPINRNSSDDTLVMEKISVDCNNNEFCTNMVQKEKKTKKTIKFLSGLKKDDLIILGIIFLLFLKRENPDSDENNSDMNDSNNSTDNFFNLDKIKRLIPIDQFSENDILLFVMLYLLL